MRLSMKEHERTMNTMKNGARHRAANGIGEAAASLREKGYAVAMMDTSERCA